MQASAASKNAFTGAGQMLHYSSAFAGADNLWAAQRKNYFTNRFVAVHVLATTSLTVKFLLQENISNNILALE